VHSRSTIDIADRMSRRRAIGLGIAALVFLGVQLVGRPFFVDGPVSASRGKMDMWALNAVLLLVCLAIGGGLFNRTELRVLVNDEVSQMHYRTSVLAAFWVAMILGMLLYLLPQFAGLTGREAVYLLVTASVGVALLAFSWQELRAHRDG
jgi:hypothetical protein